MAETKPTVTVKDVDAKARTDARSGAEAVADAVKKVADAAVAAVKGAPSGPSYDFDVALSGARFEINGTGFGANGVVTIGGHQADTVEWGANRIIGKTPGGLSGEVEVVVHIDDKTKQTAKVKV